jgi:hypothetical protein
MSYKQLVQATPKGLQRGMKTVLALCLAMLSRYPWPSGRWTMMLLP